MRLASFCSHCCHLGARFHSHAASQFLPAAAYPCTAACVCPCGRCQELCLGCVCARCLHLVSSSRSCFNMLCRSFFFASVSSRWCFVLVSLWGGARACKRLASRCYSRLGFWIGSDAAACPHGDLRSRPRQHAGADVRPHCKAMCMRLVDCDDGRTPQWLPSQWRQQFHQGHLWKHQRHISQGQYQHGNWYSSAEPTQRHHGHCVSNEPKTVWT